MSKQNVLKYCVVFVIQIILIFATLYAESTQSISPFLLGLLYILFMSSLCLWAYIFIPKPLEHIQSVSLKSGDITLGVNGISFAASRPNNDLDNSVTNPPELLRAQWPQEHPLSDYTDQLRSEFLRRQEYRRLLLVYFPNSNISHEDWSHLELGEIEPIRFTSSQKSNLKPPEKPPEEKSVRKIKSAVSELDLSE